jgi:hypothetical protein
VICAAVGVELVDVEGHRPLGTVLNDSGQFGLAGGKRRRFVEECLVGSPGAVQPAGRAASATSREPFGGAYQRLRGTI